MSRFFARRTMSLLGLLLVEPACAANSKPSIRIEPRLSMGQVVDLRVKRGLAHEGDSPIGVERNLEQSSEITYRIEVAELGTQGDLLLKVTYLAARVRGRDNAAEWEVDWSRANAGGANFRSARSVLETLAAQRRPGNAKGTDREPDFELREALGSSMTVRCENGNISNVSGLDEVLERPWTGPRDSLRWRVIGVVSLDAVRRDLELLFSSAASGIDLHAGAVYALPVSRGHAPEAYRLEGEELVDGKRSVRLELIDPPRGQLRFTRQPLVEESRSSGQALVSLEDGLAIRLKVESVSTLTNASNGCCNTLRRTVELERLR